MKRAYLLSLLSVLLLVLTACGSARAGAANRFAGGGSASGSGFSGARSSTPLSPESRLALGTMKLEGTSQAVSSAAAAKLIPLWQLLAQLYSSSSSAPQEVAAVMDQIKATMTPGQLSTINSMSLTQADMFSAFQEQAQANGSRASGNPTGQGSAQGVTGGNRGNGNGRGQVFFFQAGPQGGGGFGGGGFGGAAGRPSGGAANAGSQTSSSLTAAQAAQARQNAISSLVINQLIRLLETKLAS